MWINPSVMQLGSDNPVSHCPDSEKVVHDIIVTIKLTCAKLP